MGNVIRAMRLLHSGNYTCVVCGGLKTYVSKGRGVAPMLEFINANINLSGFAAADVVVGRAAAMLFALKGIKDVYGCVISKGALKFLSDNKIKCSHDTVVDAIINRNGTDICPMERAVEGIVDPSKAHAAILKRLKELQKE